MSDLTDRLRRYSYAGEGDEIAELIADIHWAADRIEQLEAAIFELQYDESYCGIHGKCPQCKAKTLLENKDGKG